MPRAEAGSLKAVSNQQKSKGLGRLRWYCQACEKQCRDSNGFACHVRSESHVRNMMIVAEDSKNVINNYSKEFLSNFINQLKTSHREKAVQINHFYQTVIADKNHIHMNSTKWKSLTEFGKYLSKEGICRVEETEKGMFIAWIDNSPETMRKREAVMKKERQDKGDEEREQRLIQEQVERAQRNAPKDTQKEDENPEARMLQREAGEKVTLNLGLGAKPKIDAKSASPPDAKNPTDPSETKDTDAPVSRTDSPASAPEPPAKIPMSFGAQKPKNVFASTKKNPLAGKKGPMLAPQKKMTEQERIMKAEMEAMERKRSRPDSGFNNAKRPKISLS
ncbi:uncharacterized protein N7459_000813 [Penicillium hispanicum]|uniref:uncharacterized protein n=1 Tax=Penicillium hispanicum TaxID=1080232 RepID=UPI00253FE7A3|nr:uncharacterized protein N7459_000813 [Penicillium hispanicum]KAJ5594605.1 hypothetical protein N7459_000813 [Penicillium hispanicum]